MAGLIRVTALATARRRAGFAFSRAPLVLGPESLGVDIAALHALAAIVSDPLLLVERSDEDQPDVFVAISETERTAIIDMATAAELAVDDEAARAAIRQIVEGLIGEQQLQSPEEAETKGDDAAASPPAAEAKADGGTDAAPAAETPPASSASAADGEQSRAGADASEAAPAAGAEAGKQPENTQQPPVAEANQDEPKKGDAVPAEAKADVDAKPRSSSGRKPAAKAGAKG
ncbi:hypothetical protein [Sphingopyxis alaskensis]|uniref:hypothetical protein n=1 Tax=Sphingopyxis alaskensis TaxID=117207 RepID=UPI00203F3E10|nr:hypothetical protein [Sphingopyxis alaskensis]MCM3419051.1 hypothetical protein [Sphingopyxis alaskensis]